MRERDASKPPTERVTANIGSGPFRFVASDYVSGSQIVYERNPDYVSRTEPSSYYAGAKHVYVDRVVYRIIGDPATAVAALEAGEVDVYDTPPPDMLPQIRKSSQIETRVLDKGGILVVIRPNTLQPPFDKPEARRALVAMVNRDDYSQVVGGSDPDAARPCAGFLGCGFPGASEAGLENYKTQDFGKAHELLQQAGYHGEPVVVMHPMEYPPFTDLTTITVSEMKQAGFNVQDATMDWATLGQRRLSKAPPGDGGWNIFLSYTFSINMASPALNFYLASPCDRTGWLGWPCDPTIEALRTRWLHELDPGKQRDIEHELQIAAASSVPYVPTVQIFSPMAFRKTISGLVEVPNPVFWSVRKTSKPAP